MFIIFWTCIFLLFIISINSYFSYLNQCDVLEEKDFQFDFLNEKNNGLELSNSNLDKYTNKIEDYCTQKENEIKELKKKIQREQTWKSNARKQLKKRTKQRDDLLKEIKNSVTL